MKGQPLFTEAMLNDAATALAAHRPRKGRCSCGEAITNVDRHRAQVVADAWTPNLVAEMMALLDQVAASLKDAS